MRSGINIILAVLLLLSTACSGNAGSGKARQGGLETGKVIPDVRCVSNPQFSYSVYLPTTYTDGQTVQVFLAFDPSARGSYPVSLYKELAEKYSFILVGSNDSRNGLSADQLGQ